MKGKAFWQGLGTPTHAGAHSGNHGGQLLAQGSCEHSLSPIQARDPAILEPLHTHLSPGLCSHLLNSSLPFLAPFVTPPTWTAAHPSRPASSQHLTPPDHAWPVPYSTAEHSHPL